MNVLLQRMTLARVDVAEMLSADALGVAKTVGLSALLLLVGYVLARFLSNLVFKLLERTDLDNKVASKLGLEGKSGGRVERAASKVVFYVLMAMVVIAVLDYAGLSQAAGPLEGVIGTILTALPAIGKAALILLIAYVIGRVLQKIVTAALKGAGMDSRLASWNAGEEQTPTDSKRSFSKGVGTFAFWLVMFFGLTAALDALAIAPLVAPLEGLISTVVGMLPSVVVAAIILGVGWIISKIARTVVTNLLSAAGLDRGVTRLKLDKIFTKRKASEVAGIVAMAFILLQAGVAALDQLGIATLAAPLTDMLAQLWAVLPAAAFSAIIIAVALVVGRIVRDIVQSVLESVGFDRLLARLGFGAAAEKNEHLSQPSKVVGRVVFAAIVLVAVIQSLQNIGLVAWAGYVETLLAYAVQNVLPAVVVVGIAFALGNFVRDLIAPAASEASEERRWLATGARLAILVVAFTMALHQLGVAQTVVTTTYALAFGAFCLAAAIAFGFGGRELAGEILRGRYERAQSRQPASIARAEQDRAA